MNIQIPYEHLSKTEKLFLYVESRQPILEDNAIFSDGTSAFRSPMEPTAFDDVKVTIRTAKDNIDTVYLIYNEKRQQLAIERSDELFDFYSGTIPATDKAYKYHFELNLGRLKVYYNRKGVINQPESQYNFRVCPGLKTPDWAKGAVMYQIFVDRFYNGDQKNDVLDDEYNYVGAPVKRVTSWNKYPAADGIREFYGGDLQGIIDKLEYLNQLGIDAIYLNPIFVSPSNHKYDTQDYDNIDPHFGKIVKDGGTLVSKTQKMPKRYIKRTTDKANLDASNALFAKLVEEAHKKGIKVILDGVFNHCGSFNKWMDREKFYANAKNYSPGAYVSSASPYVNYFHFYKKDEWPDNPNYDGWWGYDTLPKLNYEGSNKLHDYILELAKKWVSPPYNADGWRLDVAADLGYSKEYNHKFWRDFRKAVKTANPNALILAEHYGDPYDWLVDGDQWDTVMNYDAFMEPVTWFLTGMQKHSDESRPELYGNDKAFIGAMTHHLSRFHTSSALVAMNQLSNHDHSRFLTRTNRKVGRVHTVGSKAAEEGLNYGLMRAAVVMQMTLPGAPTIYYGDEAGLAGWTDPDNRRTYPWGRENKELIRLHKNLISMRKVSPATRTGSFKFLYNQEMVVCYGRFTEMDKVVVAVNVGKDPKAIRIPVWELGVTNGESMQLVVETTERDHSTDDVLFRVYRGRVDYTLKPYSTIVLRKAEKASF